MIARQRLASRVAVAFAIVACTREAHADDSAAAQALFDQAKKAMAAHDYASACPKLEESYRLEQGLGTLLNLADCYEHEDKLASAWSKFLEVATLARSAGNTARAQIGKQRAAALRPRVSSLVVTAPATPPAGLEVKRDGTVLGDAEWGTPIPADAGPHLFEATAPGRKPWSTSVNVDDGGSTSTVRVPDLDPMPVEPTAAEVHPSPPEAQDRPAAPPPGKRPLGTQRALAIASGGLGVVAIGVGTFFGLQSKSKHDEAAKACPQTVCPLPDPQSGLNLWSDARTDGNVSTVAFVVGAVGLAGMAALWFTAPTGSADTAALVGLGVGSVQLQGVW
jgi:hypothetical protein